MYETGFQFDSEGTSGEPTITGAKEEDGELVGVGGEWVAVDEVINRMNEFGGLNDEEKRFIVSFVEETGNYETGLKQLIDKTSEIKEGKLIKENIEMSDKKLFEVKLSNSESAYLFYKNNKW